MFIELAELLQCPEPHESMPCILAPNEMDGRRVVSGMIGCPVCKAEYHVAEGMVGFGEVPQWGIGSRSDDLTIEQMPKADDVQALLNLGSMGGYVLLVGSGARLARELAENTSGVHFIGLNSPPELRDSECLSLLRSPQAMPLKNSSVRAVLVGPEYVRKRWMDDAGRVLMPNGRLVAIVDDLSAEGVRQLAAGSGMWVGEKKIDSASTPGKKHQSCVCNSPPRPAV
jgi:hypothetical protein